MADKTMKRRSPDHAAGFTIAEVLLVSLLMSGLGLAGIQMAMTSLANERVEATLRSLADGLEQGRLSALRSARACGLRLDGSSGWKPPLTGGLRPCEGLIKVSGEGLDPEKIQVDHNLPEVVRFTSHGLILDGGTIRVAAPGMTVSRCLVISLPLGAVRWGRWQQDSCQGEASR
jgi:hypothetical protein